MVTRDMSWLQTHYFYLVDTGIMRDHPWVLQHNANECDGFQVLPPNKNEKLEKIKEKKMRHSIAFPTK